MHRLISRHSIRLVAFEMQGISAPALSPEPQRPVASTAPSMMASQRMNLTNSSVSAESAQEQLTPPLPGVAVRPKVMSDYKRGLGVADQMINHNEGETRHQQGIN